MDAEKLEALAKTIAADLTKTGSATFPTGRGKRLILALTSHIHGLSGKGILTTLEGGGCFIWDGDREVNQFRLMENGFGFDDAATLAPVLNAVYSQLTV